MTEVKGQNISVSTLIEMRRCVKSLPFFDLKLNNIHSKRQNYLNRTKKILSNVCKMHKKASAAIDELERFFDENYRESFFDLKIQYEFGKENDLFIFKRFIKYFYESECEVLATSVQYQIPINCMYNGVRINNITGSADVILKMPDGKFMAAIFSTGKPKYSNSTRREEVKVENSIELLSMYLGLSAKFDNLSVAIIYLKNDKDKFQKSEDNFEYKLGKNIVKMNFDSIEKARKLLFRAESIIIEEQCHLCRYKDICKIPHYQSCVETLKDTGTKLKTYSLTNSQHKVIYHKNGAMNVIAVPGAGKTFSLVRRLEYLIAEENISPDNILFVTFTKKAADEIKDRVMESGSSQENPNIFTFHALAYSILRDHTNTLSGGFRLAEKVDRYRLIEECLKDIAPIKQASYEGINEEFGLLSMLDNSINFINKNSFETYEAEFGKKRDAIGIKALYTAYRSAYMQNGYIEYDDIIKKANKLLEERPDILRIYQNKYKFIMVDEFQDVSKEQCELIYKIAAHKNIVVVGDDDQAIYSWRGGSNEYMLNFNKDWPDSQKVVMEDNFRSIDKILQVSNSLISNNTDRFTKTIVAHLSGKHKPVYIKDFSFMEITNIIKAATNNGGYKPGDIAIIARSNKELMRIEEIMSPYFLCVSPRTYMIEDVVFLIMHDVISMYYNGITDREFYRYLKYAGVNLHGIKRDSTISLYEDLVGQGMIISIEKMDINCLQNYEVIKDDSKLLNTAYILISCFKKIMYADNVVNCLTELFQIIFKEENHSVLENLISKTNERQLHTLKEIYQYMNWMVRYKDTTEIEYPKQENAVNLITAHKSKGREYPMVLIFGTENFDNTSEGRSLLYVAMTRAKKTLYMCQGFTTAPLLKEIAADVLIKTA